MNLLEYCNEVVAAEEKLHVHLTEQLDSTQTESQRVGGASVTSLICLWEIFFKFQVWHYGRCHLVYSEPEVTRGEIICRHVNFCFWTFKYRNLMGSDFDPFPTKYLFQH